MCWQVSLALLPRHKAEERRQPELVASYNVLYRNLCKVLVLPMKDVAVLPKGDPFS